MKVKGKKDQPFKQVRIVGEHDINTIEEVRDFISTGYDRASRTGAVAWLIKKFREDKIICN